jgi:hypothetical protein
MSHRTYFLCEDAFFCDAGQYFVILDLRGDRYLCIPRKSFEQLLPLLSGATGPFDGSSASTESPDVCIEKLAEELRRDGILLLEPKHSRPAIVIAIPAPTISLSECGKDTQSMSLVVPCIQFLISAFSAHIKLRYRPIKAIVRQIHARKPGVPLPPLVPSEINRVKLLVRCFQWLRPIFPRKYLCLFDSLALLEFLRLNNLFPLWVFGVRSEPFAAHCWVQLGNVVLNDSLAEVTQYVPIMVI